MRIRNIILTVLTNGVLLTDCATGYAQGFIHSESFAAGFPIPDNDSVGVTDTRSVSIPGTTIITDLQVTLDITGGFNGDLYAYLRHGTTGFTVLLNRVGVTGINPFGYADSGINVTLTDSLAAADIHSYQTSINPLGASLTGVWQPDGRNVDPGLVSELSNRDAMLASFNGMDPSGYWTLFVADMSPGGIGTLASWGLTVTATIVPEPSACILFSLGLALVFLNYKRDKSP